MTSDTTHAFPAIPTGASDAAQTRTLLAVSAAHLISHFHIMVLPVLLPLLKSRLDVSYLQLGLALTSFSVVSGLTQAPMGFLVDRLGAWPMLIAALTLAGVAFLSIGLVASYPCLLIAAALAGLANAVYHPANYTLLIDAIAEERIGRAFSIHTFAGFFGGAIAPSVLLALAAVGGLDSALLVCGLAALAAALILFLLPQPPRIRARSRGRANASKRGLASLLTPAVLSLTGFFALLALAHNGMYSFAAVALIAANGITLFAANSVLTAYLLGSAAGVLLGGALADRTRRHGYVAAAGFGVAAALQSAVAVLALAPATLLLAMGLSGFVFGIIQPSRDMLVRRAAPPGAEGRVFGIVSTGFNIGGIFGPMLYGWLMDRGEPRAIFLATVLFMTITALVGLLEERRGAKR